ncbi:MAG: LamG-like jellyroll fold domain-containing protein, partial [Planctomycetota bacterium]
GTPHNLPGDTDDYELTYLDGHRRRSTGGLCLIPHPGDTPEGGVMRRTVPALRSRLEKFKEETDRLAAAGKISTGHYWYRRRFLPHLAFLDKYAAQMLDGIEGRRHPTGGGWVAASAEVAPGAYVGPDAMVLGGAKVLDHAAIEDYAVVRGPGAVVSGHAKVGGQAYVAGDVKIGGYTRVLHPTVAEDKQVVPNEVPLRPFQEKGEGRKLWANYACDRDEKEVLEDWFRYKSEGRICWSFHVLNLNGHLHGRPEFVVDGGRRGFRFDGRTQYAEASPILADLGEITVDIGLKWEGGEDQAVFDFGTSVDNRFVLTPAGDSGRAELVITREGRTDRVVAGAALPKDRWARCRIEIDGERIVLRIDGRKAAEKRSAFRAADVYPAGVEKRNFIAASRDATDHFKGSIDYLRVYHTVFDDFTKEPAPRRHAPRRVSRDFIDSCRKEYAGSDDRREALIKAKMQPQYAYYEEVGRRRDQLAREIEDHSSPAVVEARRKHGEIRKKLDRRRGELRAEFDKLPETIRRRAECRKLEEKARELDARRREAVKALEAKYRSENKALVEADDKAMAEAREKEKRAASELKRLEESFNALPGIANLKDRNQRAVRLAEFRADNKEYLRWRSARSEAGAEQRRIGSARGERLRSLVADDPEIARLDREIRTCRARAKMRRPDSRAYVAERTAELKQQ